MHAPSPVSAHDLAPIAAADPRAVEALLDAAFGADRHGRTAYRLRAGSEAIQALSFAAFEADVLVGTIQCWPVALTPPSGNPTPLVLVGPVAVAPDRQRLGLGHALMHRALQAAGDAGEDALVLIGDPGYYGRFFGFDAAATAGWTLPGPIERHRLLARIAPGRVLPVNAMLGVRHGVR